MAEPERVILKCRVCGAMPQYPEKYALGGLYICEACGAASYIPKIRNEETESLEKACELISERKFAEAVVKCDEIIRVNRDCSEAHWVRALARNGVIYVVERGGNVEPTCQCILKSSFIEDPDVKAAIAHAPPEIAESYAVRARRIEQIRREWLAIASRGQPYDVFICYKDADKENGIMRTADSEYMQELVTELQNKGMRVFYSRTALMDIPSEHYEPYIYRALTTAKVMIVYAEKAEYFSSPWMKNEWTRFISRMQYEGMPPQSLIVAQKNVSPYVIPGELLGGRECYDMNMPAAFGRVVEAATEVVGDRLKKRVVKKAYNRVPGEGSVWRLNIFALLCVMLSFLPFAIAQGIGSIAVSTLISAVGSSVLLIAGAVLLFLGRYILLHSQGDSGTTRALLEKKYSGGLRFLLLDRMPVIVAVAAFIASAIAAILSWLSPRGVGECIVYVLYAAAACGLGAYLFIKVASDGTVTARRSVPSALCAAALFAVTLIGALPPSHVGASHPTCLKDGNTEYYYSKTSGSYYIIENGKYVPIERKTTVIAKLPHTLKHYEEALPTCTRDGNSEYWYCLDCKKYYEDAEGKQSIAEAATVKAALGHDYNAPVVLLAPTCVAAGEREKSCKTCGDTVRENIPATGHSYSSFTTVTAATCTTAGSREKKCASCNDIVTETIPATGHSYSSFTTVTAATCTTAGSREKKCASCNDIVTETVSALGHNYSSVDKAPTETRMGYIEHTCSRCLSKYNEETGVYMITLVGGAAADTVIYGKYNGGFYSDWRCKSPLTKISVPVKSGSIGGFNYNYVFEGYYLDVANNLTAHASGTTKMIDKNGKIVFSDGYADDKSVASVKLKALWKNEYVIYSSIDSAPWSFSGKAIFDWRNESNTNLAAHTERSVGSNEYNIVNIANTATEIVFIGASSKQFSNMAVRADNFAKGQKATVRFVNFKYTTNAAAAFYTESDRGSALTLDVTGVCSIGTSYVGGYIIGSPSGAINDLSLSGSGTMTLTAGNGADGANEGANGSNGGVGINAVSLSIDMTGSLSVTGGSGGNGAGGYKGQDGSTGWVGTTNDGSGWDATNGEEGGKGGNGGYGGYAVVSSRVYIKNSSAKISFASGSGGNGGRGGDGGRGGNANDNNQDWGTMNVDAFTLTHTTAGSGGKAGDGGEGGSVPKSPVSCTVTYGSSSHNVAFTNGKLGEGGQAGTVGSGGNGFIVWYGWFGAHKKEGGPGAPGGEGHPGANGHYYN